jgi:malate permease and related proteins
MIPTAAIVVVATALGVGAERRSACAPTVAHWGLQVMLYVLVPFIAFVNVAHLHLTAGAGAGLAAAYVAIGVAGLTAWAIGRTVLQLGRPALGALICTVILANTGYLGLPVGVTLIGAGALGPAIAYDQFVSGPMLFVVGFAVGAAFGAPNGAKDRGRLQAFLRNPPLLAVIAGLLAPASAAPASLVRASDVVVAALLPLGFFAVGVSLSEERHPESRRLLDPPDLRVVVAVALRLSLAPILLLAVSATLVRLPRAYVLQGAMPTAVNALVVGHAFRLDQQLIASAIVWGTAAVLAMGLLVAIV